MWSTLNVPRHQRWAHLQDNKFVTLLSPGRHSVSTWSGAHEFVKYELGDLPTPILPQDPLPSVHPGVETVAIADHERVAVFVHGHFKGFLGPGLYRWWTDAGPMTLQRFDVREEPQVLPQDDLFPDATAHYETVRMENYSLLKRDQIVLHTLPPGRYRLWTGGKYAIQACATEWFSIENLPWYRDIPDALALTVAQHEVAVVWRDGRVFSIHGPGRYAYWRVFGEVEIQRFDIREEPVPLAEDDPLPDTHALYDTVKMENHALLRRDQAFVRAMPPGRYRLWKGGKFSIQLCSTEALSIESFPQYADIPDLIPMNVAQHEVAAVWRGGRVVGVYGPGRYAYWRAFGEVEVQRFDLRAEPTAIAEEDPLPADWPNYWSTVTTSDSQAIILCRDKQPFRLLPAGRYRLFHAGKWSALVVGLGLQTVDVAPQDLLTQDQIPVRLKAAVALRVVDPLKISVQPDWANQAYTAVQIAMREVVTARTLDALLIDRAAVDATLATLAQQGLPDVGVQLTTVSVKDIILPGEIKDLLNRVTLAKKESEAMAIKRREETSQTRQLANTARLLESNPVLLRLKELEALGEIASKIDRITLVGSGDMVKSVLLSDLAKGSNDASE